MPTREERLRVAEILRLSYLMLRTPSGEVAVGGVGFSADPRKWHITATSGIGGRYPGRKGKKRFFRTDVTIHAVLSPLWLAADSEAAAMPSPTVRDYIIAGIEEIPPPPDIDRAELIHRTFFLKGGLATDTATVFRFTKAGTTRIVGTGCRHRRGLAKEMRICAEVFRRTLAADMTERMHLSTRTPLSAQPVTHVILDELV
jgi:hypothetical protein